MRRRGWIGMLALGALLTVACTDRNPFAPELPELSVVPAPYAKCSPAFAKLILSEIKQIYRARPLLELEAGIRLAIIAVQCQRKPAEAQTRAVKLAAFVAQLFQDHRLPSSVPWSAVSRHIDHLYQYVGLPAPGIPPAAVGAGATIAVVEPTDDPTVIVAEDEQGEPEAGVSVSTGAFSQTQTVIVSITPDRLGVNPFPNTAGFQEFGPFYDFQTFPPLAAFHDKVLVGIRVNLPENAAQAHRLQLAHPRHPDMAGLEVLARVDAGFLPSGYARAESDAVRLAQRQAPFVSRLAQRALALFSPQKLHAAANLMPGGLGGLTGSFSDFRAIDPGKLVYTQQPTSTTAGASITPAPQVTVQRENGTTITGDPGNVTVAIGTNPSGGTLSGTTTVSTGSGGVATFPGLSINNPGTGYTLFAVSDTTDAGAVPQPVTSAAFDVTTSATALVDCGGDPGGDQIFRGFYVPEFPGTTLDRVTLHFSAGTPGPYTLSLTARQGTYNGTIVGTATATVTLTANDQANVATTFSFPSPAVTEGTTVTFSLALVSGPEGGVVFYSVPDEGDEECPVVQTNGTSPPLDTFRRQGVHVKIEGTP